MSYILSALKKAEKERRRDRVIDLDRLHESDWNETESDQARSVPVFRVVLASVVLLCLIISGWVATQVFRADEPVGSGTDSDLAIEGVPVTSTPDSAGAGAFATQPEPATGRNPRPDPGTQLPPLPHFSGHMYFAEQAQLSRVFSGGATYRQGEYIGEYQIRAIDRREVVLVYAGNEYSVPLN